MKIIPDTEEFKDIPAYRISFCYLHGQLETDAKYDCFGFQDFIKKIPKDGYIEPGILDDGIYPCTFKDKACSFFYWNSKDKNGRHRGLVVYNDDFESMAFAKECYDQKQRIL